jgi:hypothetical protein
VITIDLESVAGVVVGVANGPLTLADIRDAAATVWRQFEGGRIRILWDLRDARFNFSAAEVEDLAKFMRQKSPFTDLRSAFVISGDVEFGLVRMYEILRETDSARSEVFRNRERAIAWLGSESV